MNNRGFTLLELLGVIVILALLTTLVFPSVLNAIKKSSDQTDKLSMDLISNAADLYIENHANDFKKRNGSKFIIDMNELIEDGNLPRNVKISDIEDINDKCVQVIYINNNYLYELKDNGTCESFLALPEEYQQVEYIEGQQQTSVPKTAGINLKYAWKDIRKINLSMQFLNLSQDQYGSMIFRSPLGDSSSAPYICSKTYELHLNGITGNIVKNYTKDELTNNGFKSIQITIDENTNTNEIYFGSWSDGCYSMNWQLKYLQLYNIKNELVMDLIPCYRKSDGEIGMYDLVEDKFYTNSGTGTFEKGKNIEI